MVLWSLWKQAQYCQPKILSKDLRAFQRLPTPHLGMEWVGRRLQHMLAQVHHAFLQWLGHHAMELQYMWPVVGKGWW
jgi:hypothetical protein